MLSLPLFRIVPIASTGRAAATYVPWVMATRGAALLRMWAMSWILHLWGTAGVAEFGRYQLTFEVINWVVPLVLLGVQDVAERYVSHAQRRGELRWFLRRQLGQLVVAGVITVAVMLAAAPLAGRWIYGAGSGWHGAAMLIVAALPVLSVAAFAWVQAVLRGMRAYGAVAGMEVMAAAGMFVLFMGGSLLGSALAILLGYFLATATAVVYYGMLVVHEAEREVGRMGPAPDGKDLERDPRLGWFGSWAWARQMMAMTFAFVAMFAVGELAARQMGETDRLQAVARYTVPFRMGQVLIYAAVTLWGSGYGIAARHWAGGCRRRAEVEFLRVGKFGGVMILAMAAVAVAARPLVAHVFPGAWTETVEECLPGIMGMCILWGMLAFLVSYGDLHERSWVGTILWHVALVTQVGALVALRWTPAEQAVVWANAIGLGVAAVAVAPMFLWRPWRLTGAGTAVAVIVLAAGGFFMPAWAVSWAAPGGVAAALAFLWLSGLLVRRRDRRMWRKWREGGRERETADVGGEVVK